jgi:hypothetical protein
MKDAFEQLMREADKPTQVPEQLAKYAAALVAGTHEITNLTIRPKRTWVGLSPADRGKCLSAGDAHGWIGVMEATEARLKELNT